MAYFTAIGVISNDIVRRETKSGVVTTFRLETGAPRGRKLWIDVECWGHLAGTIAHHGETGREVGVSGRLIEKVWRDRESGVRRSRLAVAALDVDLQSASHGGDYLPNSVTASGRLLAPAVSTQLSSGFEVRTTLRTGHPGRRHGRLDLKCRIWSPASPASRVDVATHLLVAGCLQWEADAKAVTLDCVGRTALFGAAGSERWSCGMGALTRRK